MRRESCFDQRLAPGLRTNLLQGGCLQQREIRTEIRNGRADWVEHTLLEIGAPQLIEKPGDVYELAGDGSGTPVDLVGVVRRKKGRSDADDEFRPDRQLAGGKRRRQRFLGDSLKRLANLEEGVKSDPRRDHDEQCDRPKGELKPAFQAEPDPPPRDDSPRWKGRSRTRGTRFIGDRGFERRGLATSSLRALHHPRTSASCAVVLCCYNVAS